MIPDFLAILIMAFNTLAIVIMTGRVPGSLLHGIAVLEPGAAGCLSRFVTVALAVVDAAFLLRTSLVRSGVRGKSGSS